MAAIAFIGLGNMGGPMAANLVKAGHAVNGTDVNPAALDWLRASGGTPFPSAREAATGAGMLVLMVVKAPDGPICWRRGLPCFRSMRRFREASRARETRR